MEGRSENVLTNVILYFVVVDRLSKFFKNKLESPPPSPLNVVTTPNLPLSCRIFLVYVECLTLIKYSASTEVRNLKVGCSGNSGLILGSCLMRDPHSQNSPLPYTFVAYFNCFGGLNCELAIKGWVGGTI